MGAKLALRMEWNERVQTRRIPFDTNKFSNLSLENFFECIAPLGLFYFFSFQVPVVFRNKQTGGNSFVWSVGQKQQLLKCYLRVTIAHYDKNTLSRISSAIFLNIYEQYDLQKEVVKGG